MESGIRSAALLTAMFLATALYLAGCATPRNEQTKLPVTLQRAQQDYDQAIMRTEETEDTLNELTLAAEIDLKQAYDTFSRSADRMREAGKILVAHADAMHYRGAYYFVESGKSATACVYPRSGEPEDKGATELDSYFNAISEEGWEVKRAWRALQFDINQIQEYLFKYPTPKGIEAITFMIRKAKVDSDLLQASLEQALAALERAKTAKAQADLNGESAIMPPGSPPLRLPMELLRIKPMRLAAMSCRPAAQPLRLPTELLRIKLMRLAEIVPVPLYENEISGNGHRACNRAHDRYLVPDGDYGLGPGQDLARHHAGE